MNVRILASSWNHTRKAEIQFLRSLEDISGAYKNVKIEVVSTLEHDTSKCSKKCKTFCHVSILFQKLFKVPATPDQQKIPFSRVNHNKYMVTDNAAYIGTSNWSGDYFVNTAGVGLVMEPSMASPKKKNPLAVRDQLQSVFERDWDSPYSSLLSELPVEEYNSFE